MNTRTTPARRLNEEVENEGVPPKVPQGVHVPQVEQIPVSNQRNDVSVVLLEMTNENVRGYLLILVRVITAQANRYVGPRINSLQSTMTCRLRNL